MRTFLCSVALLGASSLLAQPTAALDAPLVRFAEAKMLFDANAFGLAEGRFEDYLLRPNLPGTAQLDDERQQAELARALSAQRANLPEAEVLLEAFVDRYSPQPIALEAIRQVAAIAFAEKDYKRASDYYKRIPLGGLGRQQRDEVRFRLGYAAFAEKDFATSSRYLGELRSGEGEYQEPANYYYALSRYYANDIKGARKAFESLKTSTRYKDVLPGYLAQLYFAEGEYQTLVDYAAPLVEDPSTRQRDEIALLLGRGLFELERYEEALPYLELYAGGGRKMTASDFYQLGYSQYSTGQFEAAAANLKQLSNEDSKLGQQALYYLGNSHLQLNQRAEARPAFASVSRMSYDAVLREEAAWNVAKLNYELGYTQESLEALQAIPSSSVHYADAQALLGRVILASRDYARALEVLDGMGALTPQLRESKQRVLVLRGLQLLQEDKIDEANQLLSRSLEGASDGYFKALATHWLGDIAYRKNEPAQAAQRLNSFIQLSRSLNEDLPDDANVGTANYTLGYIRLKEQNYAVALGHFQESVTELRRRTRLSRVGTLSPLQNMLGDGILRAGDANFKRNDYPAALKFYEEAINAKYSGYVYAIYQRALIEGLQGKDTEKILGLETIVDDFPKSEFADDALLELGTTYQSINQLARASQTLDRLVRQYPNSELRNEALLQLGLVSYNQGSPETALNYYKQIFSNNPSPEEARAAMQALQEIYVQDLGRPNDYVAFLETVPGFKLDKDARDSINFAAATIQYQSGNYDRAIEQYSQYLQQYPKGAYALEAYFRRADSYLIQEKYKEALKDLEAVIQRGQSQYFAESLEKAALIAYNSELDFDKAYRYYAKLMEVGGARGSSTEIKLLALRAAYRASNQKAVAELARELSTTPGLPDADRAIVSFYEGKTAYDAKDYDRALTNFNSVIRNDQGEAAAEARYLVARIYYLRRDLDLAESITMRAQRESSAYPYWVAKSTLLLIDIFLDRKDYLSAKAVAEGLVANYKGDAEVEREAKKKLAEVERVSGEASLVAPAESGGVELIEEPQGN